MKYLLTLFLIILLSNCGGGGSKNHNFKVTVIDGYLAESNISIYDKDNKKLDVTKNTNSKGSFSYRDTENDLFYIKAVSGIDIMSDEVFNSVLYGIAQKGTSTIVSPLSSIVWAYNKSDKSINYKKRVEDIQDKLGLKKNILTFDPISNISNKESSKIIQFNVTLEAISRLINTSLGGSFEYVFYASCYDELKKQENGNGNMNFLYSDSFIDTLSSKLYRKYEYLNISIVDLKLVFLQKSIAYIVDELSYFEANNKELLKKNYKASLILTNPIIKESSLIQDIITKDTDYVSEYFNEINSRIHSVKIYEIIKGLKIVGGFRGMLYKISDINRATKSIKPSFFSESFLNKELLLKSSILYDKLSKSISSGAPSQDDFKDNLIKNTIFINMENKEILDSRAINQIQNQVSLSFKFTNVNAINPNAELLVREKEIETNKKSFGRTIEKLRDDIQKSENSAISISKIDSDIINKHNKESLTISQSTIYIKNELQNNNILEQTKSYQLVLYPASKGKNIIKTSLSLALTRTKEELLKEEIIKITLTKEIADYKTKLLTSDDQKIKDKIKEDLKKAEVLQKTSTSAISEITKKIGTQVEKISSTNKILESKTARYENLIETHIVIQKEEERQQDIFVKVKKAKRVYDNKLIEIENKLNEQLREYESNLNTLSISLINGSTNLTLVNKLRSELKAITLLENELEHIEVTKNDLANEISFKLRNIKTCYDRDEENLFSIVVDQNNSFVKVEVANIPGNTRFNESNYSLIRKTSDGINAFYMPIKDYNVSISVSNTDTDKKESKDVHFEVKGNCNDDTSFAFKAPLQIPNIPNLDAPELNTSSDLPNPNDGQNPPPIDNTPPEDN